MGVTTGDEPLKLFSVYVSNDSGGAIEVNIQKLPDDLICPRISLGGKDGSLYLVYRGEEQDIKDIITVCLGAFKRSNPSLT